MERHKVYYKGEGGGFPQIRVMVNLVCPCCPWLILAPKVLQLCTNHLVWVVWRPAWVSEACQLFLVPFWSSNTPFYPSKCCELGSVPRLLFDVFYLDLRLGPLRSWECVTNGGTPLCQEFHYELIFTWYEKTMFSLPMWSLLTRCDSQWLWVSLVDQQVQMHMQNLAPLLRFTNIKGFMKAPLYFYGHGGAWCIWAWYGSLH
jgi:hypothetical protein